MESDRGKILSESARNSVDTLYKTSGLI
uniref:Uncharacterized protein n=1 Tax=Anguilla anguilla TaxID=7936 RepID=A0A0E9PJL5_ANGAN